MTPLQGKRNKKEMVQVRKYFENITRLAGEDWQFFSRLNQEESPKRHLFFALVQSSIKLV